MKKILLAYLLTFYYLFSYSQSDKEKELDAWINSNNIVFNSPKCPQGFIHFINCREKQAYRKNNGDTIIIYSNGGAIAENIETLNKSVKSSRFNVFRYPSYKQNNGTIVVKELIKSTFLWKQDTLYFLDEMDDNKVFLFMNLSDDYYDKKITESEFKKLAEEIKNTDLGYRPQFKMIYFTGIFNNVNEYRFNKTQNFREEQVSLVKSWEQNGRKYFEVNLQTNTAGRYIIADDMSFINTDICEE